MRIIKAILSVIDSLGKVKPLKYVTDGEGNPLAPCSIESDSVGLAKDSTVAKLATEATLSAIRSKTDRLNFDKDGNLYTHDPVAESQLTSLRSDLSALLKAGSAGIPDLYRYMYLATSKVSVPSGEIWYVGPGRYLTAVSLSVAGYLRNEGLVTVMSEMDVDGGELDNVGEVVVGW